MSTDGNIEALSQDIVDKGSTIIELIDVKKVYVSDGVPTEALRGISFKVTKGEFIAVVGPSGSGKSTLLHLIGGLDRPTSGRILIGGNDINKLSDDKLAELRNEKIGFVFQFYNLVPYLPVIKNVELPLIVKGVSSQERRGRVLKLLEEVGLKDKAFTRPTRLSGGEQQRVAIARALINNPEILLADEPTGNLDSKNSIMIAELFRRLNDKGRTILMVTHNLLVASYAKRILYIRDGLIEKEENKA
ncbi:MAG: ABC transporter ATP-binding protein [Thaumarchaeota archaeon]|nr:ABC transporter ATP-binding protein [Candidatus Geocrenenecus arthurdayi]MCL7391004.1 ABC transporter ATP-binding protein [Candidatus Geocrenenecus arthurdayi]MCL7396126.1 ABC transporter ATP-binding protein [Candidatus Geocrenenecus arthurdayi]MCL7403417.1 ABC transporter ATP-binding protein [Candidatus Geocrenenecus arthurdayi]